MKLGAVKTFFVIAGLYDVILGLAFAFFWSLIYSWSWVNVNPQFFPSHPGYINLTGLMVFIFGVAFFMVAGNPVRMKGIAFLGLLFKIFFSAVVFWHAMGIGLPSYVFMVLAIIDIGFALGIIWYLLTPVASLRRV